MPLRLGAKAERALRMLLGLRNPQITSALAAYGFTDRDRREGWDLLQALGNTRAGAVAIAPDVRTEQALDAWENVWFAVAKVALERHYPATHARLFLNLSQTEGPRVAVSICVFLDRFDAMSRGEGSYGAEGPQAAELLARRGMTAAVVAEARELLAELTSVAGPALPLSEDEYQAEVKRAEDALWAWYLEWSAMARIAIKQRALLRQLGFRSSRAASDRDADPASETEDDEPPVP